MPIPIKVRTRKTMCQPKPSVIYPPSVGANIGESPKTSINLANTFGISFTGNKSRTIVNAATEAPQLPTACINLKPIK